MKKLMIAAAIVCAAVMGQAANLKWGTGEIKGLDGETPVSSGAKGYIFSLTDAQYNYLAQYATDNGIDKAMAEIYNGFTKDTEASTLKVNNSNATLLNNAKASNAATSAILSSNISQDSNTRYNAAMIILYTENGEDYYKANIATYTTEAQPGAKTYGQLDTKWLGEDGITGITWQAAAVPEPTSGLLLLLGMAGLALRRRRA